MFFLKEVTIGVCEQNTLFIFQIARFVITILQILVPFALIVWGSLDFFKAVIAGDEKEMKAKRKPFVSRLVSALVILILPAIVNLVVAQMADKNDYNTFSTCWTKAGAGAGGLITIPGLTNPGSSSGSGSGSGESQQK